MEEGKRPAAVVSQRTRNNVAFNEVNEGKHQQNKLSPNDAKRQSFVVFGKQKARGRKGEIETKKTSRKGIEFAIVQLRECRHCFLVLLCVLGRVKSHRIPQHRRG